MSTTFDEGEYDDIATAGGYGDPEGVAEEEAVKAALDDVESQMSEAEYRLEIASYYKMLLNQPIFEGVENEQAAAVVEAEIREFVRTRLAALLGVAIKTQGLSPQQTKLLSLLADEAVVTSLLELVSRLLKKPSLLQGAKKKLQEREPEAAPVPVAPKAKPSLRRVRPEAKPEPVPEAPARRGRAKREPQAPEVREVVSGPQITGRKGRKSKITQKVVTQGVDKDGNPVEIAVEQDLTRQTMTPANSKLQPTPFVGATSPEFDAISAQHAAAALKIINKKLSPALGGG